MLDIRSQDKGVVTFSGVANIDSANALREALLQPLRDETHVAVDLSGLEGCDAAALQVLLAALANFRLLGKTLVCERAPSHVTELARTLGIPGFPEAQR